MSGDFDVSPLEHFNTEPLRVVEALVSEIGTLFTVPIVIYLKTTLRICQGVGFSVLLAAEFSVILPR